MKFYFQLQSRRLVRWFDAIGVNHLLGVGIFILLFIVLSMLLFHKTELAPCIYSLLCISALQPLSKRQRNGQLKLLYSDSGIRSIRFIENNIVTLPFIIYLIYEQEWAAAAILLLISSILSIVQVNSSYTWVVPTPFRRLSFEYIVGFRQYLWIVLLLYFVIVQAIIVANYNLGMVCLGFLFFLGMTFYFNPEHPYFVWIQKRGFHQFIKYKMIYAAIGAAILTGPALIALLITFTEHWINLLSIYLIAHIIHTTIVLAKYSSYPREMNLPQTVLYFMSVVFPPLIPFTLWIFYKQSKRKLEPILSW